MASPEEADEFEVEDTLEEIEPEHARIPWADHDVYTEMETLLQPDLSQEPPVTSDVEMQAAAEPQATQLPQAQPKKVDTSQHKQKLLDIVLQAVLSELPAEPVEKAIQTLNEHCEVQQHPVGSQLLDFTPQKITVPGKFSCHSPLMIACEKKDRDLVRLLLRNGASAAFRNKDKLNALHIACSKGDEVIVDLLLTAARNEKRFSKKKKDSSDLQWMLNARNQQGWNPLMFAIKGGHIDVVKRLIETGGVNYKTKNRKQCNILHIASREPHLECLKETFALFDKDSDSEVILATDKKGWNILHHACANKHHEALEWLLNQLSEDHCKTLINQQNEAGYPPLLTACEYHQKVQAVQLLVDHGADVLLFANEGDDGLKSGLHIAAIHDAKDIAKLLIDKECPVDIQDSMGNSALHVAFKKSSFEVMAVLRQSDADRLKLDILKNKAGVIARDIIPDDIIPPEIKKRGKEAIDLYKKALKEGKQKIPRCNLLILGEARVGKTSVYRLLVGLGFNEFQDPTMGIENTVVDTVDKRFVNIDLWEEKPEDVQMDQSGELFAEGVLGEVRDKLPPKKKPSKDYVPATKEQLMRDIQTVKEEIERINREASALAVDDMTMDLQRLSLSRVPQVPFHSQTPPPSKPATIPATPQAPRETTQKVAPIKEHPEKQPHVVVPEQKPAVHSKPSAKVDQPIKPPVSDSDPSRSQPARPLADVPSPSDTIEEPDQPEIGAPIVNRKHRHFINKRLKSTPSQEPEEPSLILNTLDFAGQPEYRPMHHCFITRRAIYLVVFNLQDMVKFIELKESKSGNTDVQNPLEEVRYWLHSIHAHIYPPDKDIRGRDETMNRVCLVGTHRGPTKSKAGDAEGKITDDQLDKIDQLLRAELRKDDRCVNHIHYMTESTKRIFAAVENSIDSKDAQARLDSGAKMLQVELKFVSKHLRFLEEDYPIVWLQFEAELMRQREYRKQQSQSMVIQLEELKKMARQHGITDEAQDLAFKFFHDIGKIVYLEQTPKLFLNDEERTQLADLVILDPAWLIKVIKVIFEIKDSSNIEVAQKDVRDLEDSGVASSTLLKKCWEEFTRTGPTSFHQLCLMLKANCLIYPVSEHPHLVREDSDPLPRSSPSLTPPAKSQTTPAADDGAEQYFLVPCKLPEKKTCETPDTKHQLRWMTFYFDFQKFLPKEIYHRLVCLMVAASKDEAEGSRKRRNTYSKTCCLFHCIDSCKWKIELQENLHQLKVSVIKKEGDDRSGSYFITKVHTEYLQKICQSSNLQGLEYYGGPLVKCTDCEDEGIIEFVGYVNGKNKRSSSHCSECSKSYCVDDLLKPQVRAQVTTDSKAEEEGMADAVECLKTQAESSQTVRRNIPPNRKCVADGSTFSKPDLNFQKLTILKWEDENGKKLKPLRIIDDVAPKWHKAGRILGIDICRLDTISKKNLRDPDECCCDVFKRWIDSGSDDYPVTWEGLVKLLKDLQMKTLADNLKKALHID